MTMNHNLYAVLSAGFPADKSKPALSPAEGKGWSYGALDELAGRVAAYLVSLGCQPGDRLAAQTEKSFEAVALYLGCLRAGVAYLPLNTAYTRAEVEYFLKDAEPRVFVCRPTDEEKLRDTAREAGAAHLLTLGEKSDGSFWQGLGAINGTLPTIARGPDDLAAICYTSGTTGRSKGAMLTHRNLSSNAETLAKLWGFKGDDVLLHALPIFHVHGLFVALHTALISGSEILFLTKFDARQVIGLLPRASVMMGVPTFYTRLLGEKDFTAELTSHMRLFISGSAPLLAETHKDFSQRTGKAILERYGMTETGMLASNPLSGARRAGTVGKALPGVEIRIADDQGRALPQGEVGVVEVKGPNIFPGYWRRPERRAEDFRADGFFITGDVGLIEPDGYLTLVGRAKDLIITGGYNVYPKEVELLLDALPGVTESAVIGLPHPDFGEAVTAVITGEASPLEVEIIARCKHELAGYKVPKRVIHLPELPRNAMGKVQKALLRETYKGLYGKQP